MRLNAVGPDLRPAAIQRPSHRLGTFVERPLRSLLVRQAQSNFPSLFIRSSKIKAIQRMARDWIHQVDPCPHASRTGPVRSTVAPCDGPARSATYSLFSYCLHAGSRQAPRRARGSRGRPGPEGATYGDAVVRDGWRRDPVPRWSRTHPLPQGAAELDVSPETGAKADPDVGRITDLSSAAAPSRSRRSGDEDGTSDTVPGT